MTITEHTPVVTPTVHPPTGPVRRGRDAGAGDPAEFDRVLERHERPEPPGAGPTGDAGAHGTDRADEETTPTDDEASGPDAVAGRVPAAAPTHAPAGTCPLGGSEAAPVEVRPDVGTTEPVIGTSPFVPTTSTEAATRPCVAPGGGDADRPVVGAPAPNPPTSRTFTTATNPPTVTSTAAPSAGALETADARTGDAHASLPPTVPTGGVPLEPTTPVATTAPSTSNPTTASEDAPVDPVADGRAAATADRPSLRRSAAVTTAEVRPDALSTDAGAPVHTSTTSSGESVTLAGRPDRVAAQLVADRAATDGEARSLLVRADLQRAAAASRQLDVGIETTDLGHVRVSASRASDGLHLQLSSDQADGRARLAQHLEELRTDLRAGGVGVGSLGVGARQGGGRAGHDRDRHQAVGDRPVTTAVRRAVGPTGVPRAALPSIDGVDLRL